MKLFWCACFKGADGGPHRLGLSSGVSLGCAAAPGGLTAAAGIASVVASGVVLPGPPGLPAWLSHVLGWRALSLHRGNSETIQTYRATNTSTVVGTRRATAYASNSRGRSKTTTQKHHSHQAMDDLYSAPLTPGDQEPPQMSQEDSPEGIRVLNLAEAKAPNEASLENYTDEHQKELN